MYCFALYVPHGVLQANSSVPEFEGIVKGRQPMTMSFGWRRFSAGPLYSEDSPSATKHKVMRFLYPGQSAIASIYGPITFGKAPVLMFRHTEGKAAG